MSIYTIVLVVVLNYELWWLSWCHKYIILTQQMIALGDK